MALGGNLQSASKTRFHLWLPLIFLGLSIGMEVLGRAEMKWIEEANSASTRRHGGPIINDFMIRVRFVDRALNAPAFVASRNMPYVLRVEGWESGNDALRFEADLWYLLFVPLMWFLIGYRLERWRDEERKGGSGLPLWRNRVVRLLWFVYGVFVCWDAAQYNGYQPGFERWFQVAVFGWGIGLISAGLCPFSPSWRWVWRAFYGVLGLLGGTVVCWYGIYLLGVESRIKLNHSGGISVSALGVFLSLAGIYLLLGPIVHRGVKQARTSEKSS